MPKSAGLVLLVAFVLLVGCKNRKGYTRVDSGHVPINANLRLQGEPHPMELIAEARKARKPKPAEEKPAVAASTGNDIDFSQPVLLTATGAPAQMLPSDSVVPSAPGGAVATRLAENRGNSGKTIRRVPSKPTTDEILASAKVRPQRSITVSSDRSPQGEETGFDASVRPAAAWTPAEDEAAILPTVRPMAPSTSRAGH